MVKVDLRTVTLNIPPQEVITRDNVPASVNAVAYFRVIDPRKAIVEVENYLLATSQISQTALRSVLGKAEFDQLLSERERLNEELQGIIDESTEPWGVKVTAVEIKDVEIPEQMQRAIARQAEAERERRAKIINSEGEFQAAQKLTDAADIISTNPASLQLRYLQTLLEIGSNQNTTVVFPLPMDMLEPFLGRADHKAGGSKAKPPTPPAPPSPPAAEHPRSPTTSPPRGPELARDTHRPAERAADDPRPRPRRAPGQLLGPRRRSRRARRTAPSARGTRTARRRSSTPCARAAARADSPGWLTRVVPNLYPALGDPSRGSLGTDDAREEPRNGARRPRPAPKRAPSPAAATRCWPRARPANRTSSPRGRRRRPRGHHQLARST